jgi:uncharacterized protein (TIGR02246 family)
MIDDERAIRDLIKTWTEASQAGDIGTVLRLMTDDVIFMVPGREPFGKEAFAATFSGMKNIRMTAVSDINEIEIAGDWAWCRAHLAVTVIPQSGNATKRSGYTLSVLKKQSNGAWAIARDANLLTTANPTAE